MIRRYLARRRALAKQRWAVEIVRDGHQQLRFIKYVMLGMMPRAAMRRARSWRRDVS